MTLLATFRVRTVTLTYGLGQLLLRVLLGDVAAHPTPSQRANVALLDGAPGQRTCRPSSFEPACDVAERHGALVDDPNFEIFVCQARSCEKPNRGTMIAKDAVNRRVRETTHDFCEPMRKWTHALHR